MLKVIPSSVSHSWSIYSLYVIFLVATKIIDNCKSDRCPVEIYLHTVVLVALHGASVEPVVEDVAAIETHAPFPVMRRPLQLGIHPEYGTTAKSSVLSWVSTSVVVASQLPVANWYDVMKANTTAADTILDRLVHAGVRFELKGTSLRQKVCGKVKADLFIH